VANNHKIGRRTVRAPDKEGSDDSFATYLLKQTESASLIPANIEERSVRVGWKILYQWPNRATL